jgi:hypothetical protein
MVEADSRASVEVSPKGPGFLSNLFGLYFGPKEAFVNIVKRPSFWLPLLLFIVIQIVFTGVWLSKMDMMEFLRNQAEAGGKPFQAPPPEAMGFVRGMFWAIALLVGPILCLCTAAVYLFIFRFFLAGEVTFKQSMAIVTYTFAATALVGTPLIVLVFMLKGDWNLVPQEALQTNLSILFAKDAVAKPLWAFLGSLDLMSFWTLFLLAVGFGVATKRPTAAAFWAVATPWLIYVIGKVALAFF